MQANELLTAHVLDIIFDGKNKTYGAYQLRKTYNERLIKAIGIVLLLLITLSTSFFVTAKKRQAVLPPILITDPVEISQAPDIAPPPPPPPPQTVEPPKVRTEDFVTIVVKPDDEVKEQDKPPVIDDLENAKIGFVKSDGIDADIMVGPAKAYGTETGVVSKPEEKNIDNEFKPIEIESQYPGGPSAWRRFLQRNIGNSYPQEAIDSDIQGTVVIQFIVDKDGTVSNVEAISGPEVLKPAAIAMIRKSGKWEPAIQNGAKVKSYKKQPLVFRLDNN